MDIQGHEGRFIKGAHEFLTANPAVPVMMEFWPYAIMRSGLGKEEFVNLLSAMYRKYITFESGYAEEHLINEIDEYFDLNLDPKGGSSVMLCN